MDDVTRDLERPEAATKGPAPLAYWLARQSIPSQRFGLGHEPVNTELGAYVSVEREVAIYEAAGLPAQSLEAKWAGSLAYVGEAASRLNLDLTTLDREEAFDIVQCRDRHPCRACRSTFSP